ncbi:hypothetical protein HK102_003837 [Quaeritorhiza haematococci]|nr:hypothetical protein HK102_003837 [Quaeritorhiza haematococci]
MTAQTIRPKNALQSLRQHLVEAIPDPSNPQPASSNTRDQSPRTTTALPIHVGRPTAAIDELEEEDDNGRYFFKARDPEEEEPQQHNQDHHHVPPHDLCASRRVGVSELCLDLDLRDWSSRADLVTREGEDAKEDEEEYRGDEAPPLMLVILGIADPSRDRDWVRASLRGMREGHRIL